MWISLNSSTTDHIFCIRHIPEIKWEYNEAVYQLFKTSRKLMIQLGERSCIIFSLSGITMKVVRLIKVCVTETYSRVRVGKNLYDMFPFRNGLKQGDGLSPLLFNFVLEYAIRRVRVNQDALKFNGTHQLFVLC